MPFNSAGVYTPAAGATTAAPGDVIRSATWNSIFTDISTALSTLGAQGLANIANVLAFGADPSGAADSTTSIQNAINSLSATSGIVFFPKGVYKISAPLTISVTGISLIGAGRLSSVIRNASATTDIITITASYTRIDSLALIGTTGVVATAGSAISASNSQGSSFNNLFISDVFQGMILDGSTNNLVTFCKFLNIYGPFGIQSSNGGGDMIICNQLDPIFWGNYTATSGFTAWAQSTVYALNDVRSANGGFFVCTVAGTSSNTGTGPVITAFNTTIVDGTVHWLFICSTTSRGVRAVTANSNFIAFNDISGPWSVGISLVSTSDGTIIKGNTIGQIIGNSISMNSGATNTQIEGNVISGAYGPGASGVCELATTTNGTRVVNNEISGTGSHGILIQADRATISNNLIQGYGQISGSYGIEIATNVSKFKVIGNSVVPTSTGAIQIAAGASDYYNVIGNIVEGGTVVDGGSGIHKTLLGNN